MTDTSFANARRGFYAALPFWLGFFPLGFILGAQAASKGMSVPTAAAMSFFNYAGGSEFAAVAVYPKPQNLPSAQFRAFCRSAS